MTSEDWEMEAQKDEIYLEEYKRYYERKFWEWYEKAEGQILITDSEGNQKLVDQVISEPKLPF